MDFFEGFLTQPLKGVKSKEIKALYYIKHPLIIYFYVCLFSLNWPILETRAEILQKLLFAFGATEFQEKLLLRFPDPLLSLKSLTYDK